MAASIRASQVTEFQALLSSEDGMWTTTVLDLSSNMGGQGTAGGVTGGSRAGAVLAAATAVVVTKHVARHYRGGHPRTYLPLGVASDLDQGRWQNPFPGDVQTAWAAFIADCVTAGSGCTITGEISVSYFNGRALRVVPVKDPIVSYSVSPLVGSQRRRNRRQ
jgi:hypothetical protein